MANVDSPLAIGGTRVSGQEVRQQNVLAAMSIANIVKSSLGPVGLDKMMVDAIGDVTISNDGATILQLLEVEHPAAKVLVELARQQDKEVGDGTTSVVIIASELLRRANDLVKNKIHPTTIISGYRVASKEAVKFINDQMSLKVDALGKDCLVNIAKTSMSSKIISNEDDFFGNMAVDALLAVKQTGPRGENTYPINSINILKSHGKGSLESMLIKGYAINNTVAAQSIKTRIVGAKIACLDMNLQRARMHLGVNIVIDDPNQLEDVRKREIEITIEKIHKILEAGANVVLTTKGIDDLCLKPFVEAGAMAVRRVKKEDMKRIAKATGATMVSTLANLEGEETFEPSLLGFAEEVVQERVSDDECILIKGTKAQSAASVILRGANDYMLDEMERSLHDSLCAVKRTLESNSVVPGGGAVETALSIYLENFATTVGSREQLAIAEFANAMLVIPKQLAVNAAKDSTELVSKLRAYHNASQNAKEDDPKRLLRHFGLDLIKGEVRDNVKAGVLEPSMSKVKMIKAATEAAIAILRIDDFLKLEKKHEAEDPHAEISDHEWMNDAELGFEAEKLAKNVGARLVGPVGHLRGHYLLEHEKNVHHSHHERRIQRQNAVRWSSLQVPQKRLHKRTPYTAEQVAQFWDKLGIHDPGAGNQWHLFNKENPADDLNVTGVWLEGITGNGTKVAIIDDGLDYEHPDLHDNFFLKGSWDFNGPDPSPYPKPKLSDDRHGTRCAGEVAAMRNDKCGVGVAYDAQIAGIRILSAEITEADEAASITYGYQDNQIFSCSWGPADDGQSCEGPPPLVAKSFKEGIDHGRGGLGSIYVFATGNGGGFSDNCNFDGYTNSLYTITIGALDRNNGHPSYSEACSAQMAVTYSSSGGFGNSFIYTTDVMPGECTDRHGGTSAAAPLAAGIIALVLSVRPDLHWRDIQRLCVETSVAINLADPEWVNTTAGRPYNHKFGYGRLDAYRLVEKARTWKTLGKQTWYEVPTSKPNKAIPQDEHGLNDTVTITQAELDEAKLWRLEHVTVTVKIPHQRRGDIVVTLYSPNNQVSYLATHRPYDSNGQGLIDWTFSSVKHWDEPPVGKWTLNVRDSTNPDDTGTFEEWSLKLWGESKEKFVAIPPPATGQVTKTTLAVSTTVSDEGPTEEVTQTTPAIEVTATSTGTETATPEIPPEKGEAYFFSTLVMSFVVAGVFLGFAGCAYLLWKRRSSGDDAQRELYQFQQLPGGRHVDDEDLEAFLADPVELDDIDLDEGILNGK